MNPERVFRILWGPTLENALDFAFPVVGAAPMFARAPRPKSAMVPNGTGAFASITGRYYRLKLQAKYFGGQQNFGATGLQAFIDWAADSNQFTLMPNIALPTLTVTGCYLEGPFTQLAPSLEDDSTQTLSLTILHPTVDLGVAWRGLFFEYIAGQSLTDPMRLAYSRNSVGYEITPQGYLLSHPVGGVCDGNYPDRVSGLQTTLLKPAIANDVTNPEDLSNASWDKTNNVTVTANNAKAPDQATTADLVVATVTNASHTIKCASYAIAAGDVLTGVAFIRDGGLDQGRARFVDGADNFNITFNLTTGVFTGTAEGAAAVTAVKGIKLAGGWFMLWWRGTLNNTSTTARVEMVLRNSGGAESFAGDAASGIYLWGATAVHGAANGVASYTPTSSAADVLNVIGAMAALPPQASWFYVKLVECGAIFAPGSSFPSPLTIGNFTAPNWRTIFYVSGSQYAFANGNSVSQVIKTTTSAPTVGQVLELLGLVFADGSVKLLWAIASGAEQTTTQSGAPATPIPASYGVNNALIGNAGAYGTDTHQIAIVRFGPLVTTGPAAVTAIAQARYA